ncbi:MAG TPA: MBL fold metallo-hydrolase [Frankiaceae bacterium]|jgi:glyoxylase-like metal-dependent hydrolase (beta-lactamase superfamily II)|nr:MBL fold metallo-hydrolase [Frankiaceae bacterium]
MQWTIGGVRVTKVVEHEIPIPLNGLLVDVPEEAVARHGWLKPDFLDDAGLARLSIHGLVIDTGERRILVDTCVGNLREGLVFPPAESPFIDGLAAAGYAIEDIDTVVCTHLHFDHVGWNTRLQDGKWVVTFTNARYLIGRVEWEHWSVTDGDYSNVGDTVRPVVESGAADLVEVDHQICSQVRLVPTPGHTPGHVSVVIESDGQRAVITGDMAHHPIQFAEPDIAAPADSDSPTAAKTRRLFLAEREQDRALVIGTHFGGPTAGRIVADGESWRLEAEPGA